MQRRSGLLGVTPFDHTAGLKLMLWLRLISMIRAARERKAGLPDLDTSAFRPPESQRATTGKDIEEFVQQVQASNLKCKNGEWL